MRHDLFNEKNRSHKINAATAVAAAAGDDDDDDSNDSSIPKSRTRDSFYKIISFPFTILHAPFSLHALSSSEFSLGFHQVPMYIFTFSLLILPGIPGMLFSSAQRSRIQLKEWKNKKNSSNVSKYKVPNFLLIFVCVFFLSYFLLN